MENISNPKHSLNNSVQSVDEFDNAAASSSPIDNKTKNNGGAVKKANAIDSKENDAFEEKSAKKKNKPRTRKKKIKSNGVNESLVDSNINSAESKNTPKCSSSDTSEMISDFSIKINSVDNLRKPKQSRVSVPTELKGKNQQMNVERSSFDSKFQSKSLDLKSPNKSVAKKPNSSKKVVKYESYIPLFKVQQGLKRGEFIEGALRINPRNYEDAYVNSPDGQMDIYIGGMQARNRAMNGDIVCVQINPKQEWRVLCDAIKDYQEKSGEIISETIIKSKTPSPCKVHTPDKFRSRPVSSNSWGSPSRERLPDTLEILGVDKLTQQFKDISMSQNQGAKAKHKKKAKNKTNNKESNETNSTSYSHSQESSEDCLDKPSPPFDNFHDTERALSEMQNSAIDTVSNVISGISPIFSDIRTEVYPACDMNDIGTFSLDISSEKINNSWETEDSSFNIIISPEELLKFDDESLLNQGNFSWTYNKNDDSNSDVGAVIVPPGDLSGDEFTDSASIDSSHSQQLDQILEDAAFLASQQDAQNNNVDSGIIIGNSNVTSFDSSRVISTANTSTREKSMEIDCRMQNIQSNLPISYYEVNSDSVVCSAVSEIAVPKCYSSSDENINESVIIESHAVENIDIVNTIYTQNKKSKSKKSSRKSKKKHPEPQQNKESTSFKINELTVEQVMEHPLWPQFIQKTGKVIHVLERKHSYIAAGHLKLCPDKNRNWALFSPNDSRVPRMMIPMFDCPKNFYNRPTDYTNVLFLASIVDWNETSTFASGHLIKCLGNTGDVVAQTEGMLIENSVDYSEFPDEVLNCLPEGEYWTIPSKEYSYRRDFRKECVFTIDPATARDMDDAVSCEILDNGNYAVGVHIADVSYFVDQNTELDKFAQQRANSVYLVQKVVPMLPRKLCDDLCSLNPGKDRLTFSVVWEITPKGEVRQNWIGRSVINSCIKLSYEHAQSMIENPDKIWLQSEHPELYGNFDIKAVIKRVNQLNNLAVFLREKRFSSGALRLDQVKLQFTLDQETGLPSGFNVFIQKDSNKLIEEFMLLANMTVARKIYDTFPELSLLRRHPPPEAKPMRDTVSMCESVGVILDASSSGALQSSIAYYKGEDFISKAKYEVLMHLCSKPMNQAKYFCTGIFTEPSTFHHYALNVPIYTHFTSPIRRYPDIIVHRLLGAALHYNSPPDMSSADIERCAKHCNDKKYNAKKVSDQSAELFLTAFIRELGCVHSKGMVVGVMDHSFDCLILDMGLIKRVYCNLLPLEKKQFTKDHGISVLNLFWTDTSIKGGLEQAIVLFALVDVVLTCAEDTLQLIVKLKKPEK